MAWSWTTAAQERLEAIVRACARNRKNVGVKSLNVFFAQGKRHFFRTDGGGTPEGGISGRIFAWEGDVAHQVGDFLIDGQGNVLQGPALFTRA
jgi:hypothetical protein